MPNNNGDGMPDADLATAPRYDRTLIPKKLRALAAEEREASLGGPDDQAHNEMMSREFILFLISEARASKQQDDLRTAIKYLQASDLAGPAHQIVFAVIQELVGILDGEFPPMKFLRQAIQEFVVKDDYGKDHATEVHILLNAADVTTPSDKDTRAAALLKRYFWPFVESRIIKRTLNLMSAAYQHGQFDQFRESYEQGQAELTTLKEGDVVQILDGWADPDAIIDKPEGHHIPIFSPTLREWMNNGGPSPGDVMAYQGISGIGKSNLLCNEAAWLSDQGIDVFYLSLELTAEEVWERCFAISTGVHMGEFEERRARIHHEAKKRVIPRTGSQDAKGSHLRAAKITPFTHTVAKVRQLLKLLRQKQNFIPKVLLIDYAELLNPSVQSKDNKKYSDMAKTMDDLTKLADEEQVLLITVLQANRKAIAQEADLSTLRGSFDQAGPISYIISFNQTVKELAGVLGGDDDEDSKPQRLDPDIAYLRLRLDKNRKGPVGARTETTFQQHRKTLKIWEV